VQFVLLKGAAMLDHSKSEFSDERREILEVLEDEDPKGWESFHARSLFMMCPIELSNTLEKQLERAARLKFENDREEANAAAIEVYYTIYLIIGDDPTTARRKAEDLGGSAVKAALGNFF
jgi:hypothetical protein